MGKEKGPKSWLEIATKGTNSIDGMLKTPEYL